MFENIIIEPRRANTDGQGLTRAVLDPLADRGSTVVPIASKRQERPWQGSLSSVDDEPFPPDETCLLCPGGKRANGKTTPKFDVGLLFENDFPVLSPGTDLEVANFSSLPLIEPPHSISQLYDQENDPAAISLTGECWVGVYSPEHDRVMSKMNPDEIRKHAIEMYVTGYNMLGGLIRVGENKGKSVGNSLIHPHIQIYADHKILPLQHGLSLRAQKDWQSRDGKNMMLEITDFELKHRSKDIIYANKDWAFYIWPFGVYPFEAVITPRHHIANMSDLMDNEKKSLAEVMAIMTRTLAVAFARPNRGAEYMMMAFQEPKDDSKYPYQDLYFRVKTYLRQLDLTKYFAVMESMGQYQRDTTIQWWVKRIKKASEEVMKLGVDDEVDLTELSQRFNIASSIFNS